MNELGSFVTAIKHLEKQLVQVVISSWLFSLLPLIIQNRLFDLSFNIIVTIVAGIAGTASILSVYLGNLKHVSDLRHETLNYRPVFKGFTASISLLLSAGLFYGYYFYAKQSNEWCLLLFGLGTFIFFRTLSSAASTILTIEQQRIIWHNMSPEERMAWFDNQRKLEKLAEEAVQTAGEATNLVQEIQNEVKEMNRDRRRDKWNSFWGNIWRKSKGIRKKIGLYTLEDKFEDEELQIEVDNMMKLWNSDFHRENIQKIEKDEIRALSLEPKMIKYYEYDREFKYFFITEFLDSKKASWYIENLKGLKQPKESKFNYVVAVLPTKTKATKEGISLLEGDGIHVFRYEKTKESSQEKRA